MESSIRPITSPIPTKPIPICRPDLKQSPNFIPSSFEKIMMTMGSMTVGPRSRIYRMISVNMILPLEDGQDFLL